MKRVALLAEFTPSFPPHPATTKALRHSSDALGLAIEASWVSTADITDTLLGEYDGFWVAPGSPYKSLERTLDWTSPDFVDTRFRLRPA